MHIFLEVVRSTARIIISLIEIAMFARAILSWFPVDEEGKLSSFLNAITEPVIFPIRVFFNKMGWAVDLPIDIPFFVTFLLLSIVGAIL